MRKLAHLVELIRLAWYYVIDFSRRGRPPSAGAPALAAEPAYEYRAWQVPLTAVNIAYWTPLIVCTV